MITKLTNKQIEKIPYYIDKWLKIGLSTEPFDEIEIKKSVKKLYNLGGLKEPNFIIFVDCPYSIIIASIIIKNIFGKLNNQIWNQVRDQVLNQVFDQVRNQVNDQVWNQVLDQVNDQVWNQVFDQVRNQVSDQVSDQIDDQMDYEINNKLFCKIKNEYKLTNFCFGQNDASWLSYYDFFRQECNLKKETEKLNGLIEMCKTGWLITYKNVCIISKKPKEIHMENKLLHNLNGPSILFNNGFSIYSFRGIKIPSDWIENPKSLTAEIALGWNNIEQRRAACEILGWDKILNKLNSNIIDNDNEEIGQLLLVNIPNSGEEKFLRVKCGTGRIFVIPVPPEMQTAKQANAWTYGLETNQLNVEVRT